MVYLIGLVLIASLVGYWQAQSKAQNWRSEHYRLRSLPAYHGWYVALRIAVPSLTLGGLWWLIAPSMMMELALSEVPSALFSEMTSQQVRTLIILARGDSVALEVPNAIHLAAQRLNELQVISNGCLWLLMIISGAIGAWWASRQLRVDFPARERVESVLQLALLLCASVAILTTLGIVLSLLSESLRFFGQVSIGDFLFGLHWSPQIALRSGEQVGSSGHFGVIPLLTGTLLITTIAMFVAIPIGLMSAIYLAGYASKSLRSWIKPTLEALAGIPTVVYGFFAALTVGPWLREVLGHWGWSIEAQSALVAGSIMGVMILPFVSSLTEDIIQSVPRALWEGSYGLGATKSETISKVVLPAAFPGIVGAFTLAVSRAIGETMIVVMAAGLSARLTANPFESVTTVTVQITTLLVGDQEFDDPKTLSAFGLGLVLFTVTLLMNLVALRFVKVYQRRYA